MSNQTTLPVPSARVDCLDGLRGLAALWVLLGHTSMLTGWYMPVLGDPALGVDLFIMLSGFLMVFHHQLRATKVAPDGPGEWRMFWIRRFFRIAPLYYVALIAALLLGGVLYESRMVIDAFVNAPPQDAERYLDRSLANVLLHVTFLFGLLPDYAFRTPLPDWSLALEMQFYALFPVLMVVVRRLGWIGGIATIAASAVLGAVAISGLGISFPMPTFLPLKMHVFASGMLLAAAWTDRRMSIAYLVVSIVLVAIPLGGEHGMRALVVREALVIGFFALVLWNSRGPLRIVLGPLSRLLGSPFFHWLGELSFGTYLVHLLVLMPVSAWAIGAFGTGISPLVRFLVVASLVVPVTYALAFVGYRLVEVPGQKLGAWVGRRAVGVGSPMRASTVP